MGINQLYTKTKWETLVQWICAESLIFALVCPNPPTNGQDKVTFSFKSLLFKTTHYLIVSFISFNCSILKPNITHEKNKSV